MIQDIAPHQYHNEFTPCTVTGHDRILSYDARSVLVGFYQGLLRGKYLIF